MCAVMSPPPFLTGNLDVRALPFSYFKGFLVA